MNRKKIILICTAGITSCLVLIIIAVILVNNYTGYSSNKSDNSITARVTTGTNEPKKTISPTSTPKEDIITSKTQYIIQTTYVNTDSENNISEDELPVPADIIAMDREELEDYLDEYIEDMPLNEYLDGLLSYEIVSFSDDKVILRKTYASDWAENEFYICDVEGEVVVFYGDKDTIYEYTGIKTKDLSSNEQVRVKVGYFVADEEELYALLESYSS